MGAAAQIRLREAEIRQPAPDQPGMDRRAQMRGAGQQAERGSTTRSVSPQASTIPPEGSQTTAEPRWMDSRKRPRQISARTGLAFSLMGMPPFGAGSAPVLRKQEYTTCCRQPVTD
jgi:hypothetical protein